MKILIRLSIAISTMICLMISCNQEKAFIPEGVTRLENFKSKYVDNRNIDIYLPAAYHRSESEKFPVIYMHDGQMLFDTALCWNGKSWYAQKVLEKSYEYGFSDPAIIVGIWNNKKRWEEYMPEDVFNYLARENHKPEYDKVISNDYLKFIVEELKPEIDNRFRTKKDKDNTIIMGSSMGGLISWYGLMKYPLVFGKAACMSTHWPGADPEYKSPLSIAIQKYFTDHLPKPGNHKFYFDHGTETLDQYYQPYQYAIDTTLITKGFRNQKDFISKQFDGEPHDELAWNRRLQFPFEYLLKPEIVTQ